MEASADLAGRSKPVRVALSTRVAIVCILYAAIAVALFPDAYFAAFGETRMRRYYVLIPLMIFLGLIFGSVISKPKAPLTFLWSKLVSRGLGASIIILLFMLCLAAFTAYKHNFSGLVTFFGDPALAKLDEALHFGDPWRVVRSISLPDWLDRTFYILYSQFWIVQLAAVVVFAAFVEDDGKRLRYFVALTATAILLGVVVRLAGSSAGPIFYDRIFGGERFADLLAQLKSSNAGPDTLKISDYLFASYSSNRAAVGTGISAMPSFHVAIAVLNAIYLTGFNRIVGALAWTYATVIMLGSVYFGWHYAVDGYVSIAAVLVLWSWAGRVAKGV